MKNTLKPKSPLHIEFMGPLCALLLIGSFIAITTSSFFAVKNFMNISLQVSVLAIVAIGSTIVILTGGIDLSPGSMIAILSMIVAVFVKLHSLPLVLALPLTMLIGGLLGAFNGFLVSYLRIPAFIVTLATMSGFRGLSLTIGPGSPVFQLSDKLRNVFYGSIFGFPLPLVYVIILYVFFYLLLQHSKFGREIYAIGGNESAANLSGINVRLVRFFGFVLAGFCASIGGILLSARLNSGSPNYGAGTELQAIAAAVVGGASLSGGRGSIISTLLGALIIVVVQNGLNLNSISTSMQELTIGAIIIVAVAIDIWGRYIRERSGILVKKRKLKQIQEQSK